MSIRLLRDDDLVFTIEYATCQLVESAMSLHPPLELEGIFTMAHDTCGETHGETILKKAAQAGLDPSEVENKLRSPWHSQYNSRVGVPWSPSRGIRPPAARIFQCNDTEEELK